MIAAILMILAAIAFFLRLVHVSVSGIDLTALGLCLMAVAFAVSWTYYRDRSQLRQ